MRWFRSLPPMARACLLFLGGLTLLCWLGPLGIGFDPHRPDWDALSVAPGVGGHWFGTDAIGRDVFARTLAGGRLSLTAHEYGGRDPQLDRLVCIGLRAHFDRDAVLAMLERHGGAPIGPAPG